MNKTQAKKYLVAIRNAKAKHLTSDVLSKSMGIYPEIIRDQLSFFNPMMTMDMDINIKTLIPQIEDYIKDEENKSEKKPRIVVTKNDVNKYESVQDFIYKKMTINGLVDKYNSLSEVDLKILKKLVDEELQKYVKKSKKKAKKRR